MKTIKQIAEELGVSKQAVQKRITREPLCTSMQPYISTEHGTKYIDENGERLIIEAFSSKVYKTVDDNVHEDKNETIHTLVSMLQEQLQAKDKQIEELTATIKIQAQSINADRHNELAGTIQKQIADTSDLDKPKKSFFDKFFKRG